MLEKPNKGGGKKVQMLVSPWVPWSEDDPLPTDTPGEVWPWRMRQRTGEIEGDGIAQPRMLADGAGIRKMKIQAVNLLFASVNFLSQGKTFPLALAVPSACS